MRIAFFEDSAATGFGPLNLMRPTFELVCGRWSLRERVLRWFPAREWGAFLRNYLAELYAEEQPHSRVNDFHWLAEAPTLLINGRWHPRHDDLRDIGDADAGICDDTLVYVTVHPEEVILLSNESWDEILQKLAATRRIVDAGGRLRHRPWDLINDNATALADDAADAISHENGRLVSLRDDLPAASILGPRDRVQVSASAEVDPYVVFDARKGPVSVADGAQIQAFTRLEGPCHVGPGARIFRGNIRGETTIGADCRVGGEVEASILHSHVNKYHDGFLGHSYVCPWVNLGALSTNSDLKNDYSSVRVPLSGEMLDTGTTKAGCYLGDHTKTALGSLFNTGSSVGVMTMILPGGGLLPKHVPSFSRIWNGQLDDGVDVESALTTAATVMSRRDCRMTPAYARLIRFLAEFTRRERAEAIARFEAKQRQRTLPRSAEHATVPIPPAG